MATLISSVTFLAYPGEGFSSNWIRLVQGLMVPLVLVAIIGFVVPLFRRVIKLSTYEYFEKRGERVGWATVTRRPDHGSGGVSLSSSSAARRRLRPLLGSIAPMPTPSTIRG